MLPVTEYPTPLTAGLVPPTGLEFPAGGLTFDAGFPLRFPPDLPFPGDLARVFPSYIPQPEKAVYEAVRDACSPRALFAPEGSGLLLPATFSIPADISLFAGMDSSYPPPVQGAQMVPIPVVRGWPVYPGDVPAIGVAESVTSEDAADGLVQAGFAGDVFAKDDLGNVVATCAYYAEPQHTTVVVELIHTNRDQRDRLHDQLWRVILPLRNRLPGSNSQIRDVRISAEKQDLPVDEQPIVMYVSLFTVEVTAEALVATDIRVDETVIEQLTTTPIPTPTPYPYTFDVEPDLT